MNYPCPCCGNYTYEEKPGGTYYICPVCYWEDDPIQLRHPAYTLGANPISLEQARRNYKEFAACDKDMIRYIRKASTLD